MTSPSRAQTVGVLGGGQLGRMLALEGRRMGYRIVSWTGTDEAGPAALADLALTEPFDSPRAFQRFIGEVSVASVEFENVPRELLDSLEAEIPLAPSARAVAMCQDREREKRFLIRGGFPCPHHAVVDCAEALSTALADLPGEHGILKAAELGYDGKGQRTVHCDDDAVEIWSGWEGKRAVLEERVDLAGELSVLVVRDGEGSVACYDPAENFHRNHILDISIIPARYPGEILTQSREIALAIAEALGYEGVMAIEFFLTRAGRLLVNELAPRPHNSGHHTLDACQSSQFEQQLRVAFGLPIGGTALLAPSVMWNLLGDLWPLPERPPAWQPILEIPGAHFHLYGKSQARPGRKMGHVTFTALTSTEALAQANRCRRAFGLPVAR